MVGWSRLSQLDLTRLCKNTLALLSLEQGSAPRLTRRGWIVPSEMTKLTLLEMTKLTLLFLESEKGQSFQADRLAG